MIFGPVDFEMVVGGKIKIDGVLYKGSIDHALAALSTTLGSL